MPLNLETTAIAFENVSVSFADRILFDSVSYVFESRRSYAILGPSGSGKTTLLALAGGLVRPSAGTVAYSRGGEPIQQMCLSWVTQTTNSIGSRTALENVAIGALGRLGNWRKARLGALDMLESLGIAHLADRRCRELSGGELQRVVIGRALAGRPDFLLADEPTGQLDLETSELIARKINEQRGSSGLLVVTHDETVANVCETVLRVADYGLAPIREA